MENFPDSELGKSAHCLMEELAGSFPKGTYASFFYVCIEESQGKSYAIYQFDVGGSPGVFGVCLDNAILDSDPKKESPQYQFDVFRLWKDNIKYRVASKGSLDSLGSNNGDGVLIRAPFFLENPRIAFRVARLNRYLILKMIDRVVADVDIKGIGDITPDIAYALHGILVKWLAAQHTPFADDPSAYANASNTSIGSTANPLVIGIPYDVDIKGSSFYAIQEAVARVMERELRHNGDFTVSYRAICPLNGTSKKGENRNG